MPAGLNETHYVFFRSVRRATRLCAVRSGAPFPAALRPDEWVNLDLGGDNQPDGFDPGVAEFSCSFQGFYLFNLNARTTLPRASASTGAAA